MNQEKKQLIQNAADTVISYIDQLPTGQVIPSDWKAPDEFTYEKNIINGIPIECLTPKEKKQTELCFRPMAEDMWSGFVIHFGMVLYNILIWQGGQRCIASIIVLRQLINIRQG